jgi:hypothetical protein
MSSKRSVWKIGPDGRTVRRNQIAGQWTWWTIEAMESPTYRALSLSAHRVIARIRVELGHHGGRDNGKLPVTFQDFEDYGIHRHAIAPAIREVEALGFARITQHGRAGNAEFRTPNLFALTHLPTDDGRVTATDDWRKIKTMEEATAVAEAARKASARYGKLTKKSRSEKTKSTPENRTEARCGNRTSTAEILGAETALQGPAETAPLSISRGGGGGSGGESTASAAPHPALSLPQMTVLAGDKACAQCGGNGEPLFRLRNGCRPIWLHRHCGVARNEPHAKRITQEK